MYSLDEINEKLLKSLLADGRLSGRKLSAKFGMSTVTVISRIKKMEQSGIIMGYAARLNHEKLGYTLPAIIEVTAKKNKLIEIEERISVMYNTCAVYDVTGSTDIMIIAKFRNRDELSAFVKGLASLDGVEDTLTRIVLSTSKEDFRLI